jgi:hypothetical protein
LKTVKSRIKNVTIKDSGEKAFDVYKKRGESMRKAYLKPNPEKEKSSKEVN